MSRRLPAIGRMAIIVIALVASPALAAAPGEYRRSSCSIDAVVDQVRSSLKSGSPAHRRYLRTLLGRTAAALPEARLRALFDQERDPGMLEELAAAMALRTDRVGDPEAMRAVAQRALNDGDPAARAALVRALRRTSALENTDQLYQRLVQDPSPEVRREAAQNLIEDNREVYAGQLGQAADSAVAAAVASRDPEVTAKILANISTESIGAGAAQDLIELLGSPSPSVRAAAAAALGGVPSGEMAAARAALVQWFGREQDPAVRKAMVAGVARLGFAQSVPTLEQLRRADPSLQADIDRWVRVLNMGLQEWRLILREKQKLEAT